MKNYNTSYHSMIRIIMACCLLNLVLLSCLEPSEDPLDGFTLCDDSNPDYFEPSNKTFIAPTNGDFIDTICVPLVLEEDRIFIDLNAEKVCLLEQHLGAMSPHLRDELCEEEGSSLELDAYYYQYLGLSMGGQEYIFVNAFILGETDSTDWVNEPYLGDCYSKSKQWRVLFNLEQLTFEQYQFHFDRQVFYPEYFPNFCSRCTGIEDLETFQLELKDLCLFESNYDKLKDLVSEGCYSAGYQIDFTIEYYLQYIGVRKNDQRWIYVNAGSLYGTPEEQAKMLETYAYNFINYCDGGRSYWGVLFDLDTQEFSDLQFDSSR